MSSYPDDVLYAKTHEWARFESHHEVVIGITDFAQEQLGDIVFVELPEIGDDFQMGDECGVVESVKAAADIYAPVTGRVKAINSDLEDAPDVVNTDPFGEGWFFVLESTEDQTSSGLLKASEYEARCDEEG